MTKMAAIETRAHTGCSISGTMLTPNSSATTPTAVSKVTQAAIAIKVFMSAPRSLEPAG